MENLLDIHILHWCESFDEVKRCAEQMPDWANVWIVPGKFNAIGAARNYGFSLGSAPFVSFADPDDTWYAHAYERCVDGLLKFSHCSFAFTLETMDGVLYRTVDDYESIRTTPFFHGVIVFRRDIIELTNPKMHPFQRCHETGYRTRLALQHGPALFCPVVGRDWKMHDAQTHKHTTSSDNRAHGALFRFTQKLMRQKELVCLLQ